MKVTYEVRCRKCEFISNSGPIEQGTLEPIVFGEHIVHKALVHRDESGDGHDFDFIRMEDGVDVPTLSGMTGFTKGGN